MENQLDIKWKIHGNCGYIGLYRDHPGKLAERAIHAVDGGHLAPTICHLPLEWQ